MKPLIYALIAAAGTGSRMGSEKNKLFIEIGGKTIFLRTVEKFASCPLIDKIIVSAAACDMEETKKICGAICKEIIIVEGGSTRTQSVYNGLKAAALCDIILIHDGARPFVSQKIIEDCIESVKLRGSAVTAIPSTDTVKRADGSLTVISTVERQGLYNIQTPQGFIYKDIMSAYEKLKSGENFTDDSLVYEKYFGNPFLCMGEPGNVKITYPQDLKLFSAEEKKEDRPARCGIGYDSHRFEKSRRFVLGGVEIPYGMGLFGHSDADALTHAVIDSMLSAAGCGDIGTYFPDTDQKYKDADSLELLKKAAGIIAAKGYAVLNISCVIICEKPKLAPYIPVMKTKISKILGLTNDCVGISAKTNEGMGFTGRCEGISVNAVCLLKEITD